MHFNELLLTKAYNVWAKESSEELCLMPLKTDAKFKGQLTWAFKNDIKNSEELSFAKFSLTGWQMAKLNHNKN